jgi:hypothetical protein
MKCNKCHDQEARFVLYRVLSTGVSPRGPVAGYFGTPYSYRCAAHLGDGVAVNGHDAILVLRVKGEQG